MPTVTIFSDPNFLTVCLIEQLLSRLCKVVVVTSEKKEFEKVTGHITNKANFIILPEDQFLSYPKSQYAIFVCGFIDKKEAYRKFNSSYKPSLFGKVKSLVIFPREVFDHEANDNLPVNGNLGVIYTGDLLGPRIDMGSNLVMAQKLNQAVRERNLSLGVGDIFYPLFAVAVAKDIVKWIFSFGPYGKEMFLLGSQVSGDTLWSGISKFIPELRINYENNSDVGVVPRGIEIKTISSSLGACLKETMPWIVQREVKPNASKKISIDIDKNTFSKYLKKYRIALLSLAVLLLLPFILLAVSAGLFAGSFKSYLSGRPELSRNLILLAKTPAVFAREESRVLKFIPVLGAVYKETFFAAGLASQGASVGTVGINLANSSRDLLTMILGDEVYDPEKYAQTLSVDLNFVGARLAEMDADAQDQAKSGSVLAEKAISVIDFARLRQVTEGSSRIAANLSEILGKGEPKTYLVLFQNNMEIRPTGGFIGSFGLLTFEGGRMTDLSISDIYSADGQLKGHIEPPTPIKSYLNEANWWFRDSNWDPDFPTSAKRAEWFLDKEVDRKVDGVFAVDLYPIKNSLNYTGPIYLPDYDMDVTSENIYEKTQAEAHEDFFPGTHQKASFLTALSRNLITQVGEMGGGGKAGILKVLFDSLEGRHVQLYLHNDGIQNAISSLNWSGEVQVPECRTDNCYADFAGLVEANLGVNKANYFIARDQRISVAFDGGKIVRQLTVETINSANPSLGVNARYKNYMRIILPKDANVGDVFEVTGQDSAKLTPDIYDVRNHKEVGFLTEVLAGQSKKIVVSWTSESTLDFQKDGEYDFYLRKQAGTGDEDNLSISIVAPKKTYLYNTALTRDFYTKIKWTNRP